MKQKIISFRKTNESILNSIKTKLLSNINDWDFETIVIETCEQIKNNTDDLLTYQSNLIKIAKTIATQNGNIISTFIKNFTITDTHILIEIAKIAAAQNAAATSRLIRNYSISNPFALIEIAKIAAAQNGAGTSGLIKNYGITNSTALIEIAKIAATQNGENTSRFIKNYNISNQQELIEIAKIAITQNSEGTSKFIKNYAIINQKARTELYLISLIHNINSIKYFQNYDIEPFIMDPLFLAQTPEELDKNIHGLPVRIQTFLFTIKKFNLFKESAQLCAIILEMHKLHNWTLDEKQLITLIQALNQLQAPILKFKLVIRYFEIINDPLFKETFAHNKTDSEAHNLDLVLRCITLHKLPKTLELLLNLKVKSRDHHKQLLLGLLFLQACPQKELVSLLIHNNILHISKNKQIAYILDILNIIKDMELMNIILEKKDLISEATLRLKHQKSFQQKTGLSILDNFEMKFEKTIRTFRRPEALLTYAALINTRSNEEKKLLTHFIESILNETFYLNRYQNNLHIATLSTQQAIEWKNGKTQQLSTINFSLFNGWTLADTDNPEDLLLVGTEVDGSCQRVDGNGNNRGLLAYIMDGKYRALVIKNTEGRIVARAMLRLMWNETVKIPVIFMERTYVRNGINMTEATNCLISFARERAKTLDILLVKVADHDTSTGPELVSLGSPAHYEYVDALNGLIHSEYTISSTEILWEP